MNVKMILAILIWCISMEAYVSGASGAAFSSDWYKIDINTGIIISPEGGDYSAIHEESARIKKLYAGFQDKITDIIKKHKKNGVPLTSLKIQKFLKVIDGSVIEDLSENKELLERKKNHFNEFFQKGDILGFDVDGELSNTFQFNLIIYGTERIKRSSLNKIKQDITNLLNTAEVK